MIVWLLGMALTAVGFVCSIFVIAHAFRRSVGTGVMVLCVPCYSVYYAFSQFEHRYKGAIIAGYLGCLTLGSFLTSVSVRP